MSNIGKKWTVDQEKWLLQNIAINGIEYCVKEMERTSSSLISRLKKIGHQMYEEGDTIDKISEKTTISKKDLEYYIEFMNLTNRGAEWDKSQEEWLFEVVPKRGIEYCAKQMSRTKGEVKSYLLQHVSKEHKENGISKKELSLKYNLDLEEINMFMNESIVVNKTVEVERMGEGPFYVVLKGRNPGVYKTWDECKKATYMFPGAKFKKCVDIVDVKKYQSNVKSKGISNVMKEKVQLSEEQLSILDSIKSKNNIFLSGSAGTGKTTTIKAIINYAKYNKINIGITATTGCAAVLIGGYTLHSFLGIGLAEGSVKSLYNRIKQEQYKHTFNKLFTLQLLIIDEVSMLNDELFIKISEYLSLIRDNKDPFGGIQVMLCGDFYQLPPVKGDYCFKSPEWERINFVNYILKTIYRQQNDETFKAILNRAKDGTITDTDIDILKECINNNFSADIIPTKIYSYNSHVNKINEEAYLKLKTPEMEYNTVYKNKNSINYANKLNIQESIKLCINAQVMVTRNINPQDGIVNGTRGKVVELNAASVTIELVNGNKHVINITEISPEDDDKIRVSYIPLKLAWAITIHKSQGVTLDCAEIDLSSNIFERGQAYTALSRVKDLKNVKINEVSKDVFRTDPSVVTFYKSLK